HFSFPFSLRAAEGVHDQASSAARCLARKGRKRRKDPAGPGLSADLFLQTAGVSDIMIPQF
uniref:hypothetical protein n=1 Tax=Dysosmobacter welbionis TaxID=2093857 RepID=UPI003FEF5256